MFLVLLRADSLSLTVRHVDVCLCVQLREDVARMGSHLHTLLPVLTELMAYKPSMVRTTQGDRAHPAPTRTHARSLTFLSSCFLCACCIVQRVRLTCLECVSHIRRLPYDQLHPHRSLILQALALAADDHKRAVRQAAAKARNQWYLLTE